MGCCAALQGRPGFGQLTDSGLPGGRVALSFSARIDPSLGNSSLERVRSGSRISFSSLEGTWSAPWGTEGPYSLLVKARLRRVGEQGARLQRGDG